MQLAERDIIVACVDYRNFPQGISFVCNNISAFGGDPNRIYLMGQSAGAHISACSLLEQATKEFKEDSISWKVSQIKAYFGLSGGYNLYNLVDHFHNRVLYRSIFLSIMEGEESFEKFSPEVRLLEKLHLYCLLSCFSTDPQIIPYHLMKAKLLQTLSKLLEPKPSLFYTAERHIPTYFFRIP